ncbi:spore coat protein [Bacillus sp. DTU_2020_1000418_1_SI_GHA_SEK_038]|uniref:spore coat protein n=1 Tax=Bacillus sp. DTU_2020_1000418_1_SI_GHA_SEK_038 TaxID=3077585 RepID=UPI0028E93072|nr:spore coat protein [Bacillus sp. DTU_2020_1000418_1_SI_GHA_SEK_038]WNS73825.1 spore coat protein [Bacillus sp. DTU_2020_1000418_1_SI_GHA_SEK_038]
MNYDIRKTLAWHETLEIHELVGFQSIGLMKLKMAFKKASDNELKVIYRKSIKDMEKNLNELIRYYPSAPIPPGRNEPVGDDIAFYAGDLLVLLKTAVRNYAVAITETATPELRKVLVNQMIRVINGHESIYLYMYRKGYYPSYDFGQLLQNDLNNAQKALNMKYE